jgi:predicted Na+-dependent transporter
MLIPPVLLLNFFVAVVMISIGLSVSSGQLLDIPRNPALLTLILLANCVLIPAIGFVLIGIFPLTPDTSVGLLLLAAIAGTPIALQYTRKAKTRLAFAAAMIFVLSLVSIALTPLAIEAMPQTAQRNQRPILYLIASIALYIALPLCAGLWAARRAPKITPRLVLPLGVLASVAFGVLMRETRLLRREAFNTVRGHGTILAMLLLLLLSMLIGWLIGGPDRESRRVLATSTGMRNVIVVLYMARYCFPGTRVFMIPLVYLSLMVPTNLLFPLAFIGWHKLRPVWAKSGSLAS